MDRRLMDQLPMTLVLLRGAIAPFLLWDALDGHITPWFLVGYVVAVLSDIFDGIIARRLGVSSANLRRADSWADVALYVCIAAAAWFVHRDIVLAFRLPLFTVIAAQVLWWLVNLAKYGKPASYHTYSAKLWGLTLLAATLAVFGFNSGGIALWVAILVGIVHTLEEIAMTLILPTWQHDVLSLIHALRLRRELSTTQMLD